MEIQPSGAPFVMSSARPFNISHDIVVALWGGALGFGPNSDFLQALGLEAFRMALNSTNPGSSRFNSVFPTQSISTQVNGRARGTDAELAVADFNQDGFDDLVILGGGADGVPPFWFFATASNVDNPSQGLTVTRLASGPVSFSSLATADLNGDGIVELIGGSCEASDTCVLEWYSMCPFEVPDTPCEGASVPALVAPPINTLSFTNQGEIPRQPVAFGDLIGDGGRYLMRIDATTPSASDGKMTANATLWVFDESFAATQVGSGATPLLSSTKLSSSDAIQALFMEAGPIDIAKNGM